MTGRHLNDPRGLLVRADETIQHPPDWNIPQLEGANQVLQVPWAIVSRESLDLGMKLLDKNHMQQIAGVTN
jgi:hypothetical protein